MLILLHTSKTMHQLDASFAPASQPALITLSSELAKYIDSLTIDQLATSMQINTSLATKTKRLFEDWGIESAKQRSAIYSFAGDIYSGLQIHTWSSADLARAQKRLRILSGLYGVLRPLDGIQPYRLELGYRLPDEPYRNLYTFWGDSVAKALPKSDWTVDLSAKEYSKLVLPYSDTNVIAPKFLTISPKTGKPTFVVVHAKIARGAFAAWMIKHNITDQHKLTDFNELGYAYNAAESTPEEPIFICKEFGGLGLSVRLQHK